MDTLGRVYELLQARHMTLYQLEKLSALPHSTLRSTRRRGGELRVETIERICLALGITLSEFFAEQSEELCEKHAPVSERMRETV